MKSLDTRDLQTRLEELESLRADLDNAQNALEEAKTALDVSTDEEETKAREEHDRAEAACNAAGDAFTAEEEEELQALESLKDDIGSEWKHGVQLIPESDFEDYARELAEDIGAIDRNAGWPLGCIDWERAANELRSDYSSATFQGTDYRYRS